MDRPHITPRILRYPVGLPKQILTDLSLTKLHGDGLSSCSIDELAYPTLHVLTIAIVTLKERYELAHLIPCDADPLKILSLMSDAMNQGGRPITLGIRRP